MAPNFMVHLVLKVLEAFLREPCSTIPICSSSEDPRQAHFHPFSHQNDVGARVGDVTRTETHRSPPLPSALIGMKKS